MTIATGAGPEPTTLDELAERLRRRRAEAGSPSFSELARRVATVRAGRGVHPSTRSPGRITVYDCFRAGRRRVDTELVLDIVRSLGADDAEAAAWRRWCVELQLTQRSGLVPARRSLPLLTGVFVGRERERVAVRDGAGPVLITGMPGCGKSQLAARALHDLHDDARIADVVTIDLRASDMAAARPDAEAVLDAVLHALGVGDTEDRSLDARAAHAAAALERESTALLVDDIDDADQIAPLVAHMRATPLLLVSRTLLALPDEVTVIVVEPWSRAHGLTLLRGIVGTDRVEAAAADAAAIVDLSGGLPLATALTAARIAARPDWTLADHRDALRARLDARRLDDAVSESIALSVASLDPPARRTLRLLATLPCESLSDSLLMAVTGTDADQAARSAAQLRQRHCAEVHPAGRIGMHVLVRTYAAAQSWDEDSQAERDAALDRVADAVLREVWAAAEGIRPGYSRSLSAAPSDPDPMEPDRAERWLSEESATMVALADAVAERRPEVAIQTAQALGWYFERQGLHAQHLRTQTIARAAADRRGDTTAAAFAQIAIGQAKLRLGHTDAVAHLQHAAVLTQRCAMPRLQISVSNALAVAAARAGDLAASLARIEEALAIARDEGIDDYVAPLIDNMAVVLRRMGDLEGSATRHREAYEIADERGDTARAATSASNLSDALLALGDVDGAIAAALRAVALTRSERGDTHAYALTNLGLALSAQGSGAEAAVHHRRALALAEEMANAELQATVLSNLGTTLRADGDVGGATSAFERALGIADSAGVTYERGRALLELAETVRSDPAASRALAERSLPDFAEGSPEYQRARRLAGL